VNEGCKSDCRSGGKNKTEAEGKQCQKKRGFGEQPRKGKVLKTLKKRGEWDIEKGIGKRLRNCLNTDRRHSRNIKKWRGEK